MDLKKLLVTVLSGASAFSPSDLGENLALWIQPDATYRFEDDAGTIAADDNGDVLGKVLDRSDNNNHCVQATTADKLTLGLTAINSKPAMVNDGTKRFPIPTQTGLAITGSITITVVAKIDASGGVLLRRGITDRGLDTAYEINVATLGRLSVRHGNGSAVSDAVSNNDIYAVGTWGIFTYRNNANAWEWFKNGAAHGSGTHTVALQDFGSAGMCISGSPFAADLYEPDADEASVIIANTALTDAQLNNLHTYLGTRFGITVAEI